MTDVATMQALVQPWFLGKTICCSWDCDVDFGLGEQHYGLRRQLRSQANSAATPRTGGNNHETSNG